MSASHTQIKAEKLHLLVEAGQLPDRDLRHAKKVLSKLGGATRVSVIGRPGSGKTSVCNTLLAEALLPEMTGPAIIELSYNEIPRHAGYDENGLSSWTNGWAHIDGFGEPCDHLIQQASASQLVSQSLLEITLPAESDAQERLLARATCETDIVIWCTRSLDDPAFAHWEAMPDHVKDHSYLVLTHADELLASNTLAQATEFFAARLADNFMALYPLAAKHALSACDKGMATDASLWAASGAEALVNGIGREVSLARQAYLDHADVLLAQYSSFLDMHPSKRSGTTAEYRSAQPPKDASAPLSPMKRSEAFATALTVLQAPVDEMLRESKEDVPPAESILDHSAQAAQALATMFMDANTDDRDLNAFRETVLEYEQMVLLLQLEGTEQAANDAVTGLLQLKKEMSEVAYA